MTSSSRRKSIKTKISIRRQTLLVHQSASFWLLLKMLCCWLAAFFLLLLKKDKEHHAPDDAGKQSQLNLNSSYNIINVGFPKSGSTSLYKYFTCAGLRTQHFCCCGDTSDHPPCKSLTMAECILKNMASGKQLLEDCGDYQVYAQIDGERPTKNLGNQIKGVLMENGLFDEFDQRTFEGKTSSFMHFLPQQFHLDALHDAAPNAVYILPLRDAEEWANSVFNWFQTRARVVNEYRHFNSSLERPGKKRAKSFLSRVYREHTNDVRSFVKRHPSHKLLEFNISNRDAEHVLYSEFGIGNGCWGQHNKVGDRSNFKQSTD